MPKDRKTLIYIVAGVWICVCLAAIALLAILALNDQPITPTSTPLPASTNTPISTTSPAPTTPTYTVSPTLIPVDTLTPTISPTATTQPILEIPTRSACHPSYPDVCIPYPPPNLNCPDISYRSFRITGPDVHGFDGSDQDNIGCEGN